MQEGAVAHSIVRKNVKFRTLKLLITVTTVLVRFYELYEQYFVINVKCEITIDYTSVVYVLADAILSSASSTEVPEAFSNRVPKATVGNYCGGHLKDEGVNLGQLIQRFTAATFTRSNHSFTHPFTQLVWH